MSAPAPVLEIYVVWHPDDDEGANIAQRLFEHFHGTVFSGLIGGGIELYVRSEGWVDAASPPRPIPVSSGAFPDISPAEFVAIVPVVGKGLARACEEVGSVWFDYIGNFCKSEREDSNVGIFPYRIESDAMHGTKVSELLSSYQLIAPEQSNEGDSAEGLMCRDLVQGIAQLLGESSAGRLKVFISHTKRDNPEEAENVGELISLVRSVIGQTRLQSFFDAHDLQPGTDWASELESEAAHSALLAIRTDLFASREWCQREVSISKQAGMPIVILDSLGFAEERGSFLMDHVPRVAARKLDEAWRREDIYRALNLLVDECLKRAVWTHQKRLVAGLLPEPIWWAPHAPEPLTLVGWLSELAADSMQGAGDDRTLHVLHPDPPLGAAERLVLEQIVELRGQALEIDILTPRQLAARGG